MLRKFQTCASVLSNIFFSFDSISTVWIFIRNGGCALLFWCQSFGVFTRLFLFPLGLKNPSLLPILPLTRLSTKFQCLLFRRLCLKYWSFVHFHSEVAYVWGTSLLHRYNNLFFVPLQTLSEKSLSESLSSRGLLQRLWKWQKSIYRELYTHLFNYIS